MLTLWAEQPECLWDEALPIEVRELPQDLAALDRLLSDPELSMVFLERWRREVVETGRLVLTDGRPTIAMETYVRLMVLKQRYRWGYRSLVAEVSDSIHLRRFCRISLSERVPDESTVRKLTRRIGAETVNELTRCLIVEATRSKRFRPRAVRVDSTVIEADVKYPTDSNLAADGRAVLAREGRKLARLIREKKVRVRDRSRSMGRKLRAVTRTIRRRSGEAKQEVLALTEQTGQLLAKSGGNSFSGGRLSSTMISVAFTGRHLPSRTMIGTPDQRHVPRGGESPRRSRRSHRSAACTALCLAKVGSPSLPVSRL